MGTFMATDDVLVHGMRHMTLAICLLAGSFDKQWQSQPNIKLEIYGLVR